jgi:predicted amidohydrolase YtcJ
VKAGKIVAVGERKAIEAGYKVSAARVVDLGGKTMIPGFVDAHGHIFNVGVQALAANLLAAPVVT